MRLLLKRFFAITALTALDAIRQPIVLLLTTSTLVAIALMPVLLMHGLGESQKLVQDSALALHFVAGLFLGGYAASAGLGAEIHRGTLSTVLSKPVDREVFFLAKFAGIAITLALFSFTSILATMMSVHVAEDPPDNIWNAGGIMLAAVAVAYAVAGIINFWKRRPFVSTAFLLVIGFQALAFVIGIAAKTVTWRVMPASLLVSVATLVLAAIALALITRLDLVPTLAVCTLIFLLGLMTDYLLGHEARTSVLAATAYNLLPNWQHFWLADALAGDGSIPWIYVRRVAVYAMFYLLGTLSLGMVSFRNVETEA